MIDTHSHLYLPDFQEDLSYVLERSRQAGVEEIWLAATDTASLDQINAIRPAYNFRCFAGLHPCEVKANFRDELNSIKHQLDRPTEDNQPYHGIGEIGLDLYWDKTYYHEQVEALTTQLHWALERNQPVLLHVRDAYDEMLPIIRSFYNTPLRGIFHSFSGSPDQALEFTNAGFLLGINGVVTFKKSHLPELLQHIPLTSIVTETDAPYLTPTPHRGKRNEPSYIPHIVDKLSQIYQLPTPTIIAQTTQNAHNLLR